MRNVTERLAVILVAFAAASTQSAAAGSSMMQATIACERDVMRYCAEDVPDRPAIIACMHRNHESLSPRCAAVFDAGTATASGSPSER